MDRRPAHTSPPRPHLSPKRARVHPLPWDGGPQADRFAFIFARLVGSDAEVLLRGGERYGGVFHAASLSDGVVLRYARPLTTARHASADVLPYLVVPLSEVLDVRARNVSLTDAAAGVAPGASQSSTVSTDREIRAARGANDQPAHRELVAWEPDGAAPGNGDGLALGAAARWDQFEVNERQFGVRTTYHEEHYTTRLERERFTRQQIEQAQRLAAEIEGKATDNPHLAEERAQVASASGNNDDDEEARYGAVQRLQSSSAEHLPQLLDAEYKRCLRLKPRRRPDEPRNGPLPQPPSGSASPATATGGSAGGLTPNSSLASGLDTLHLDTTIPRVEESTVQRLHEFKAARRSVTGAREQETDQLRKFSAEMERKASSGNLRSLARSGSTNSLPASESGAAATTTTKKGLNPNAAEFTLSTPPPPPPPAAELVAPPPPPMPMPSYEMMSSAPRGRGGRGRGRGGGHHAPYAHPTHRYPAFYPNMPLYSGPVPYGYPMPYGAPLPPPPPPNMPYGSHPMYMAAAYPGMPFPPPPPPPPPPPGTP